MNVGQVVREFNGHSSQISSLSFRPIGATPLSSSSSSYNHDDINSSSTSSTHLSAIPNNTTINNNHSNNNNNIIQSSTSESSLIDEPPPPSLPPHHQYIADDNSPLPHLNDILLTTSIDGHFFIWDKRVSSPPRKITLPEKTPPWCLSVRYL